MEALRIFLAGCQKYLFVGTSGLDADLLGLLVEAIPEVSFASFVGGDDVEEAAARVMEAVPQFGRLAAIAPAPFRRGFRAYLEDPDRIAAFAHWNA